MARPRNFTTVNGHKWAYLRAGKGPPLVLIHGFMSYADYFDYIADQLSDQFDIIAPDLPGFGFTPKLSENTYRNIAKETKQFVENLNLGKVDVFGVSLGGAICLEYALDYPDKVKSLILNSPFWGKDTLTVGPIEAVEFTLIKLPDSVLNILKTKLVFKKLANFVLGLKPGTKRIFRLNEQEIIESASLIDIDGNRELLYSLMNMDLSQRLKNFKEGTLLIVGLADKVITPKVAENLRKIIGGDLVKVRREGHEFVVESPDKLVKIIRSYILEGKKAQEKDFIWD